MAVTAPVAEDAGRAADWLAALLPPGRYYARPPTEGETLWDRLLLGSGDTVARVRTSWRKMLDELAPWLATDAAEDTDPDQQWGLLTAWETALGLPDTCAAAPTYAERRARILARIGARGAVTADDLVAAAAAIGWTITIEHRDLVLCIDGPCDGTVRGSGWTHAFIVHATLPTGTPLRCDSPIDGSLYSYGTAGLVCLINALKPAHTVAHFDFV